MLLITNITFHNNYFFRPPICFLNVYMENKPKKKVNVRDWYMNMVFVLYLRGIDGFHSIMEVDIPL